MADIFTVTSPMLVQYPNGERRLVAESFEHPLGMVYAEPFWLEAEPYSAYLIKGDIKGEGPWKLGDVIIRLLSCSDTDYAMQWAEWQQALLTCPDEHVYCNEALKISIINKMNFS